MVDECPAKHTKYQPTDAEWKCPECKSDNSHFVIDEPALESFDDCTKLHEGDGLFCYHCEYTSSGKALATKLARVKSMAPCKHCKGTGLVKKP